MKPNAVDIETPLTDHARYRGRTIVGSYRDVKSRSVIFKFDGLPDIVSSESACADHALRKRLTAFFRADPVGPDLWTMRDLTWALNLPYSARGKLGKLLREIGVDRHHHIRGLIDARTRKRLSPCDVFSSRRSLARCDIMLDDIRRDYDLQSKQRLKACQMMREQSKRLAQGS